jgi:hypothetical protein
MRRSIIWFVLAAAWGVDGALALFHRNWLQSVLTAFFASCFLLAGLLLRKREQRATRR